MLDEVVGRDREREAASAFLEAMVRGPAGLVYAGEPGIGKTTVWMEALGRARERSLTVLPARPVAAEARLAFAALADLLEPVPGDVLAGLPEPQRRALAVALLREDPGGRRLDQRAVGAAMISVLTALARAAPVMVAIDDLHWLDRPSARVLAFAVRRLGRLPVGLLACERIGADPKPGLEIEHALPEGRVARLVLEPLSVAALHQIVKLRLGRTLSRRALVRIGQAAGGNPFFAVEIARSLPDNPDPGLAVLPLPDSLRALAGARVAALPERARRALLPAAVLRLPTVELVAAGMGETADRSRHALEQAAAAGIVEVDGSRIRFTHPLFAAGVYPTVRPQERRLVRANALRLMGEILYHEQSFPEAVRLLQEALEHTSGDAALASAIELHLTYATNAAGDFAGAEPHARRALALSEQAGDGPRLAEAIAVSVMVGYLLGRGFDEAELERALQLEDQQRQTSAEMRPSLIAGDLMLYEGRLERACQLLGGLRQRIIDRGEESDLPYVSGCLAWAECWRGRLDSATAYADEAVETASRTGMDSMRCTVLALGSVPAAYAGDAEATRNMASEALTLAAATGYGVAAIWARWERTRAELDRAAARRTGDGLTDSEKLVAHLTARGLTNRQVAAQLFMSPKTVEANLARAYRKLGIRSRAELGARLAGAEHEPRKGTDSGPRATART